MSTAYPTVGRDASAHFPKSQKRYDMSHTDDFDDLDEEYQPAAAPASKASSAVPVELGEVACDGCGVFIAADTDECPHCGEMRDGALLLERPLEPTAKPASAGALPPQDAPAAPKRPWGRPKRQKAPLSPEEEQVKAERLKRRDDLGKVLELLDPGSGCAEGDPPVVDYQLADVTKVRATPLLRVPRLSGRGGVGSALVVRAQEYTGLTGGEPYSYALLYSEFHDAGSHRKRTRGVTIRESEVYEVIRVLTEWKASLNDIDTAIDISGDDDE